jgi:hypothetical protein
MYSMSSSTHGRTVTVPFTRRSSATGLSITLKIDGEDVEQLRLCKVGFREVYPAHFILE